MSRPTDRFGIGSLAAYDELISPMVAQAQLLGTADYLADVNRRQQQQQQQQQQQSVQDPVAARFMTPDVPTLEEEFKARRDTYSGILGDPEQQRNMTQAQMLFDIANTALAFSTAGSRPGMSPAERLAEAAVETKLFPTIAARSAAQQEQQQKFDLAALQSAETSVAAKQKAAADYAKTLAGQEPEFMRVTFEDDTEKVYNVNSAMGSRAFQLAAGQPGARAFKVGTESAAAPKSPDYMSVFNADGSAVGVYNVNDPTELAAFNAARDQVLPLGGVAGKTGTVDPPEPEIRTVNNQLVDVSDPKNAKVIFGEAARPTPKLYTITIDGTPTTVDINTQDGQALMEKANAANEQRPGSAKINTVSSPSAPRGFLIDGTIRMSYDNGRTYIVDGQVKDVPEDAFEVSNTTTYDVFKNETAKAKAAAQLEELEQAAALMLTRPDGSTVSPEEAGLVTNAFAAARDATGPYAAFQAGVDQLIGGFVPAFRELFQDTQDNRQYIRSLKILGSSALSVSPRLAVFDLARVERLFPDPDAFFRNPESEANKLVVLKRVALNQKRRILEEQQAGIGDTGLKAQLNQKLYEIDRLLDMLGSVDIAGGSGVDPAQLDALRQSITRTN